MVTLCYVEKNLSFFTVMHYVHVLCVHFGDQALHQTPSGGHASLGTTQQSQRVALKYTVI